MFTTAPVDEDAVKAYVDAWCKREARILGLSPDNYRDTEMDKHRVRRAMFDDLYKNLNTLDQKVAAFVQVASVLFAVFALMIQISVNEDKPTVSILILSGGALSAISVGLCLYVIYVRWPSSLDIAAASFTGLTKMVLLRNKRTRYYLTAFWFLVAAFVCLILFVWSVANIPTVRLTN